MTQDLKRKTTHSLLWNAADKIGFQCVALLVGIITARILTPTDFGYIGALALFTILSNTLVESGFTAALVRRENNTQEEYSAAFYFNILLSIVFYIALFFSAPAIAAYFKMPELEKLSRFLFLAIIINSFGIIQTIVLTKSLKFKPMSSANLIGVTLSGIITIILALNGYGYWAIAWQQITQVLFRVIILWIMSSWRPTLKANFKVISELFAFSSFLLITSVVSNSMRYVYNFFIGPRYPSQDLGYYSQAYKFQNIPATVISSTMTGVAYPVLSTLNKEKDRQMVYLRKILRITAFITFPVMIGLFVVAEELVSVVLTDKWLPAVNYFRILVLAAMVTPFINLALNTITVLGKPKLNFTLEMIRNGLILALLFILNETIEILLIGFALSNIIAYLINYITLARLTPYKFRLHLFDIAPYFTLSIIMGIIVYLFSHYVECYLPLKLLLELIIGAAVYLGLAQLLGSKILTSLVLYFL